MLLYIYPWDATLRLLGRSPEAGGGPGVSGVNSGEMRGGMSGQIRAQGVLSLRQNMRQTVLIKRIVEGALVISQKIQNKMKLCIQWNLLKCISL